MQETRLLLSLNLSSSLLPLAALLKVCSHGVAVLVLAMGMERPRARRVDQCGLGRQQERGLQASPGKGGSEASGCKGGGDDRGGASCASRGEGGEASAGGKRGGENKRKKENRRKKETACGRARERVTQKYLVKLQQKDHQIGALQARL